MNTYFHFFEEKDNNWQKIYDSSEHLMELIDNLWTISSLDEAGVITFKQFEAEGGLCESIVSSLPPITPEPTRTSSSPVNAGRRAFSHDSPTQSEMRVQCGRCNTQMSAMPPVGATSFNVTCVSCRISNRFEVRTHYSSLSTHRGMRILPRN